MKFLALALLAVCLIQGHNAQPQLSGLRNLVSNAASSVSSAANNAVSAATNAASSVSSAANNAVSAAQNAASNAQSALSNVQNAVSSAQSALSGLSTSAQNAIASATNGAVDLNSIKSTLSKLNPEQLLETITGAETLVNNAIEKVESSIETAIESASETAKAKVANATSSWNSDVAKVVNKAAAAGIDVSKCAVTSVTGVGADVAEEASGCVTKKVGKAADLLNQIIKKPKEIAQVTAAGIAAYRKCSAKSGVSKTMCHATDTLPAACKAMLLVHNTTKLTIESVKFVSTLQQDVATCATKATATSALKAVSLSKNVVSCVKSELTAASA